MAVAGALDHRAAEPLREFGGDLTEPVEDRTPPLVAGCRGVCRRGDDVGEQHGAQGAMRLRRCGVAAGEELFDCGQDLVGLGEEGPVVGRVDLQVPRAMDMVGEVPAELHRNPTVVAGMGHQGGHGDHGQDRSHVDPKRRFD